MQRFCPRLSRQLIQQLSRSHGRGVPGADFFKVDTKHEEIPIRHQTIESIHNSITNHEWPIQMEQEPPVENKTDQTTFEFQFLSSVFRPSSGEPIEPPRMPTSCPTSTLKSTRRNPRGPSLWRSPAAHGRLVEGAPSARRACGEGEQVLKNLQSKVA